jgi:hypothetical protein
MTVTYTYSHDYTSGWALLRPAVRWPFLAIYCNLIIQIILSTTKLKYSRRKWNWAVRKKTLQNYKKTEENNNLFMMRLAVMVGLFIRMAFMAIMVAGETLDFFSLPAFQSGQGPSGLFLATVKILRVASDIWSWLLISLRGTLAFQSSKAALFPLWRRFCQWKSLPQAWWIKTNIFQFGAVA